MRKQWRITSLTSETSSQTDSSFFLLETRDLFGYRMVQKFNTQGQELTPRHVIHPDKTTRTFREDLFGPAGTSIYYARSLLLNENQEKDLFSTDDTLNVGPSSQIGKFLKQNIPYSLAQWDLLGINPTSLEGRVLKLERVAKDAGVYDQAAIRYGFKDLENLDLRLKNYSNTFYWTMANYFEAYRLLSSKLFQGNISSVIKTEEKVMVQVAKKGAEYATTALKSIPFVGGAIGLLDALIDDITTLVGQNRLDNKVNAVMNIIRKKFQMAHDISSNIAKIALAVTKEREQAILDPQPDENDNSMRGKLNRAGNDFGKQLMDLKNAILSTIELNDSKDSAVQLALKDVALTFAYLFENYEEIIKNEDPLDNLSFG